MGNLTSIIGMMTILIFGAAVRPDRKPSTTLRRRVETALACAENAPEARFVASGAIGRYGPSEASVMAAMLRNAGIRHDKIIIDETGSDTLSSARAMVRLMREHPMPGRAMVATSPYHLPRCLILLRIFGIAAMGCAFPGAPAETAGWKQWYWRLREVPAVPYDAALALWSRLTGRF